MEINKEVFFGGTPGYEGSNSIPVQNDETDLVFEIPVIPVYVVTSWDVEETGIKYVGTNKEEALHAYDNENPWFANHVSLTMWTGHDSKELKRKTQVVVEEQISSVNNNYSEKTIERLTKILEAIKAGIFPDRTELFGINVYVDKGGIVRLVTTELPCNVMVKQENAPMLGLSVFPDKDWSAMYVIG